MYLNAVESPRAASRDIRTSHDNSSIAVRRKTNGHVPRYGVLDH